MEKLPKIGSLVLFLDSKIKKPVDETGYNQIGVVVSTSTLICKRGNKVVRLSSIDSENKKYDVYHPESEQLTSNVVEYFNSNLVSVPIFDLGIAALLNKSSPELFDSPIIMPDFEKLPCIDFERKWNSIEANAEEGDMVFTYNQSNFVSRLIAKLDNGSWSHVGVYIGNGYICEAVTSGVTKRAITTYKNSNIRIGLYRHKNMTPERADNISNMCLSQLGCSYNYWGAIKLGLKKILKIENKVPSPSGTIFGGQLYLVEYV